MRNARARPIAFVDSRFRITSKIVAAENDVGRAIEERRAVATEEVKRMQFVFRHRAKRAFHRAHGA